MKKMILRLVCICLIVGSISFLSVRYYFKSKLNKNLENNGLSISKEETGEYDLETEEVQDVSNVTEEKITPSTKIVYEYYYASENITEKQESVPPYFMLDLTLEDMVNFYPDWEIRNFSSREVVMRKTIYEDTSRNYIVGEHEGYVAVFYQVEQAGISLKQVTNTPVSALSKEDRERLSQGIYVSGEYELAKVLEDYES